MTAESRLFTAEEIIQIANETSDSFGNLYRIDFINRIQHEAGPAEEEQSVTPKPSVMCFCGGAHITGWCLLRGQS